MDEPRAPKGSGEGTAAATATLAATATATCATSAAPALAAAPAAARGEGRGEGHPMPHQRHWLGRSSQGKNNTVSQMIIKIKKVLFYRYKGIIPQVGTVKFSQWKRENEIPK